MLNVIDAFTRAGLAIRIARKLKALDVIDVLSDRFSLRGIPVHIRSDNGPEFIAKAVQDWIATVGSTTAYIEPSSPWENGYYESFNAKLRDGLLNGEMFDILKQASVVIEQWRRHYNGIRLHASLGYHPPPPEVVIWPTEPSSSGPIAHPAIVAPRRCTNVELGPPNEGRPMSRPPPAQPAKDQWHCNLCYWRLEVMVHVAQ